MPFIEQLATIEELADMLGLKTKRYNANQVRSCPIHGGEHKLRRSFDPVAFAAKLATGEPISLMRLEARPIAALSVEAQERQEKREKLYPDE